MKLFINSIKQTVDTVRKSGISCVTVLCITSFSELTSPITLASIFPVGRESKKSNPNVWIWAYNSSRTTRSTRLDTFAMVRIQNLDGSNIRITQALIRLATSAFGLGNLMCVFNRERPRAFQDIWAECEVVVLSKQENLEQLNK